MIWYPSQQGTCQVQQSPSREGCGLLNAVYPCMGNSVSPTTRGTQSSSTPVSSAASGLLLVKWTLWSLPSCGQVRLSPLSHVNIEAPSVRWFRWSPKSCDHLRSCRRVCSLTVGRVYSTAVWLNLQKSQTHRCRRPLELWWALWLRGDFEETLAQIPTFPPTFISCHGGWHSGRRCPRRY